MTLCELATEGGAAPALAVAVLCSDPMAGVACSSLNVDGSAVAEMLGDDGLGVSSVTALAAGSAPGLDMGMGRAVATGSRGSSSFFCLMVMTIFSRSCEVMCFSRPRLRPSPEHSGRASRGRLMSSARGEDEDASDDRTTGTSSDVAESTLADSSGVSSGLDNLDGLDGLVGRGCVGERAEVLGEQQKVSRFQSLQLRFSSRRPSSIDSAHLEHCDTPVSGERRRSGCSVCTDLPTCQRDSRRWSCRPCASWPRRPSAPARLTAKASWAWAWASGWQRGTGWRGVEVKLMEGTTWVGTSAMMYFGPGPPDSAHNGNGSGNRKRSRDRHRTVAVTARRVLFSLLATEAARRRGTSQC